MIKRIIGVVLVLCVLGCWGLYTGRNPEKETLDDAGRKSAPGKFVHLSDGLTHYDIMGPDTGRTIVLVHGFSVPLYIWDSSAVAFAAAGYRVVRYDEYGRGWSDRPNVEYNGALYDRQLGELLDSLKITGKIDLAGVSMGGFVTATFTAHHPDRVRSLVLVDPVAGTMGSTPGMFNMPILGNMLWQMLAVPTMADGQASDFADPARWPDWADRYRVQMRYHGFGRSLLSTRMATRGMVMDTLYASVAKTGVPVLLIWGMLDKTVPFERNAGVRAAIPAAEFHPIAGAGHLPILEKAGETDSLIAGFLAKQAR